MVAGELKERRAECRQLQNKVEELQATNSTLENEIIQLQAQGLDKEKSSSETQQQVATLRAQVQDLQLQLTRAQAQVSTATQQGEDALQSYKKKAQTSLSVANARTASAIQAKEDAELEARAARASSDRAMQRALEAEEKGQAAYNEAQAFLKERQSLLDELSNLKSELEASQSQLSLSKVSAEELKTAHDKLTVQVQTLSSQVETDAATNQQLQQELAQAQDRSNELMVEIDQHKKEEQRLQHELLVVKKQQQQAEQHQQTVTLPEPVATAQAESTIQMLEQELADANQAIADLKETLRIELEKQSSPQQLHPASPTRNGSSKGTSTTEPMPLFYAMEKQAELTQARNEIARLANLLGDAESERQEALDHMLELKEQLEASQAKVRRQAQFQSTTNTTTATSTTSSGNDNDDDNVNLEYLKNIVLSYLNAKTLQEKKALLPVIGTVLCLTQQEQQAAVASLEASSGSSSIDALSSTVLSKFSWT